MKLAPQTLKELLAAFGGDLQGRTDDEVVVARIAPVEVAQAGDLAPLFAGRFVGAAVAAAGRGASLLVTPELARHPRIAEVGGWIHPLAPWVFAELLETCDSPRVEATMGEGCVIGPNVVLDFNVVLGARVLIGAGTIIGRPGFGWATGPNGVVRAVPQRAGVVIEDDVVIGPLCTIDAGTLSPTRVRRGAKLDAQCHVAHNCDIGEDSMIAAQCGFAGSVRIGKGALIGGQVGVADHVTIGEGARIAGKSGVIGDIPARAVVAGYPAVPRSRWLRALAHLYRRGSREERETEHHRH